MTTIHTVKAPLAKEKTRIRSRSDRIRDDVLFCIVCLPFRYLLGSVYDMGNEIHIGIWDF
jgi:hypothetical protein